MNATRFTAVEQAADDIIRRTRGNIILGIPLGLGKPNQLVNALYRKAKANPSYVLKIYTALSLTRPAAKGDLEKRFLQPFVERVFGDPQCGGYVELDYLIDRKRGTLPPNISVHEFFVQPAAELGNTYSQQHYLNSNYTHVARDLNALGVNVLAQLVAEENGEVSLSCNPEVTLDLLPLLKQRRERGETILLVGQVHRDLPWMPHSAITADLDLIIDDADCHTTLMSVPNMPVSVAEHFIGLNASALVCDDGTLQIGIGTLGDAITSALIMRQHDNARYQQLLAQGAVREQHRQLIDSIGDVMPFTQGLYGCSEMLTYGMFRLFREHIIKRPVIDTRLPMPGGGDHGKICLHGGFFLGPQTFYRELKQLSAAERLQIDMTNISFVNHLYGNEALKRSHRQQARFINTAFTVTLMGAVVSDQLEDGRILSGVGGQYNFVAQAHELDGARSIILVRAVRDTEQGASSNIIWHYGHNTIPRHLRDIVVTEYGMADLRNKTDSEIIAAMLSICDSRFQQSLLAEAKRHGKIASDYQIPEQFCNNTPGRLQQVVEQNRDCFPEFPLGCDFTDTEQQLLKALTWLKQETKTTAGMLKILCRGGFQIRPGQQYEKHLDRMQLAQPKTFKEAIYRRLLVTALQQTKSP